MSDTPDIYTLSLHDALPILLRGFMFASVDPHHVFDPDGLGGQIPDRKSTRLNSSHVSISYAVFCLKKKNKTRTATVIATREEITRQILYFSTHPASGDNRIK